MASLSRFFIIGFLVSNAFAQIVLSKQGSLDLTLPSPSLEVRNPELQKTLEKEKKLFARGFRGKDVPDLQGDKPKNGYNVASNPRSFEPRNNISAHPLIPAREQKQLLKSHSWN
ncbi:MAG: hypothetical protein NWR43_03765 [Alphaproteobacteria bacterium]|nr:hypothetical protein [Alphaproteobacteria bacterium]